MNLDDEIFEIHASFCAVLSNPTRLKILVLLSDGELSVGDMAAALGISPSNVSQHLRVMRDRGVVAGRKEGQTVFYRVKNRKLLDGCALIRQAVMEEYNRSARTLSDSGIDYERPPESTDEADISDSNKEEKEDGR